MNGDSRSSRPAPAAIVARIRANSPRASSVVEMFAAGPGPNPYTRAAPSPASTFITSVTATAASTGHSTVGRSPGSMERPNAKKKIAPNASRRGCTSLRMRSPEVVEPSMRPTMNAPIASATPNHSETPATNTAAPRKEMTRSSSSLVLKRWPTMRVPKRAASASSRRKPKALPPSMTADARLSAPDRIGWSAAR